MISARVQSKFSALLIESGKLLQNASSFLFVEADVLILG